MSKSNFYNPEQAKLEAEQKKYLTQEEDKRKLYLEKCKRDKNFQRYIIQDIVRANISALTDTSKILDTKRTKEELADLIIANIKASETLKNILSQLL